jgi:hypothetical protein
MNELMTDVQIIIFSFLQPENIIKLYYTSHYYKNIILQLSNHIGFVVSCHKIISEKDRIWFQNHSISIELIKEYVETTIEKNGY